MTRRCTLLPLALLALLGPAASAQDKVYRCGPDGSSYSSTPCPQGREVSVADPRSAQQQQAAQDVARREADLADTLRKQRQQRERARPAGAAALTVPPPPAPAASAAKAAKKPKKKRHAQATEDGVREAVSPTLAKKKASR